VNGLYLTKDGAQTWTRPFNGAVGPLVLVPGNPMLVYVGVTKKLYLSRDKGKNWNIVGTYQYVVNSVLATSANLYVGLVWTPHTRCQVAAGRFKRLIVFTVVFYGPRISDCKTAQFCVTIAKFGQLKPSHHQQYAIVFDERAGTEVAQAGVGYRRRPYRIDRHEAPSPC